MTKLTMSTTYGVIEHKRKYCAVVMPVMDHPGNYGPFAMMNHTEDSTDAIYYRFFVGYFEDDGNIAFLDECTCRPEAIEKAREWNRKEQAS